MPAAARYEPAAAAGNDHGHAQLPKPQCSTVEHQTEIGCQGSDSPLPRTREVKNLKPRHPEQRAWQHHADGQYPMLRQKMYLPGNTRTKSDEMPTPSIRILSDFGRALARVL